MTRPTCCCAEAHCHCAFGLTVFSTGVPMCLFGEEVGTGAPFLYDRLPGFKPALHGLREGANHGLYAFCRDAIGLRRRHAALRRDGTTTAR